MAFRAPKPEDCLLDKLKHAFRRRTHLNGSGECLRCNLRLSGQGPHSCRCAFGIGLEETFLNWASTQSAKRSRSPASKPLPQVLNPNRLKPQDHSQTSFSLLTCSCLQVDCLLVFPSHPHCQNQSRGAFFMQHPKTGCLASTMAPTVGA